MDNAGDAFTKSAEDLQRELEMCVLASRKHRLDGNFPEAVKLLQEFETQGVEHYDFLREYIKSLARLKRTLEIDTRINRCCEWLRGFDPENPEILALMAFVNAKHQEHPLKPAEFIHQVLSIVPDSLTVLLCAAYIEKKQALTEMDSDKKRNHQQEAKFFLSQAQALAHTNSYVQAWLEERRGDGLPASTLQEILEQPQAYPWVLEDGPHDDGPGTAPVPAVVNPPPDEFVTAETLPSDTDPQRREIPIPMSQEAVFSRSDTAPLVPAIPTG